jgi:HEAT repeat protein
MNAKSLNKPNVPFRIRCDAGSRPASITDAWDVSERRHGVFLLGMVPPHSLGSELVRMVLEDEDKTVRRATAYNLTRLDDASPCQRIVDLTRDSD